MRSRKKLQGPRFKLGHRAICRANKSGGRRLVAYPRDNLVGKPEHHDPSNDTWDRIDLLACLFSNKIKQNPSAPSAPDYYRHTSDSDIQFGLKSTLRTCFHRVYSTTLQPDTILRANLSIHSPCLSSSHRLPGDYNAWGPITCQMNILRIQTVPLLGRTPASRTS